MAIHIHHLHRTIIFSTQIRSLCRFLLVSTFSTSTSADKATPTKTIAFPSIFRECSDRRDLNLGRQAHGHLIRSGFTPNVYVANCLIQMYVKCSKLEYASKVFDVMPQRDVVSWNTLIFGYVGCGDMGNAELVFESMPERDVVSWNTLISGYSRNGDYRKCIDVFARIGEMGEACDSATLSVVLKACSFLEEYSMGVQVHCIAVRTGLDNDVFTGSALVDMYAKCKCIDYSLRLFCGMPEKNWVSWGAVIAGCVQNDRLDKCFQLFKNMRQEGGLVSQSIYASVFKSCAVLANYRLGSQLHGLALKTQFGLDSVVGTAILDMYAKCDCLHDASKIFNSLPVRSLQSYNAIIVGYARTDQGFEAFHLFRLLQRSGIAFDEISLSGAVSACVGFKGRMEALQLHGLAVKASFWSNIYVKNAILDLYGKCGSLADACRVFDEMGRRDAVSWNSVIAAHCQNGDEERTLSLFVSMLRFRMEPDVFTYGSVLKACAGWRALNFGMEVHSRIIKSGLELDLFIVNALVDMYCKCGMMEEAEKIHGAANEQMLVSWNSIISGFSLQKQSESALRAFRQLLETGAKPDSFTFSTVLDACADLATIGLGKQIHAQIIKQEMQSDVYISNTLVDMYSKCGDMQDSRLMFDKSHNRGSVAWNIMICGYAQHGLGKEALELFESMQTENVKPNHTTFISVLRACGHAGLVDKGLHYFNTMLSDYGLEPQLEHYCCLVDIMGKSGKINDALKLINTMPLKANDVIWKTLLSSCKIHGNVEIAEKAATAILELDPQDPSAHVLLSNIYANAGMWREVSSTRKMMRDKNIRKEPGCSWIEVKDEVHAFLVWDRRHPESEEIYEKLDELICDMKLAGYEIDSCLELDDEGKEIEQQVELKKISNRFETEILHLFD